MEDCRLVREAKSLGFQPGRFLLQVWEMEAAALPGYRPGPSKAAGVPHAQYTRG